jgi:hypothetical protein
MISPTEVNKHVKKILNKIASEYDAEIIPVFVEPYAKKHNCYINVEEKVKLDGGSAHYGWAIFQSDILCEAERHAVWESPNEDLIDITPREFEFQQIMFVSDNNFEYTNQLVDNKRINITGDFVVDDFIILCEGIEKLYAYGTRINDELIVIPPLLEEPLSNYESLKANYLVYIRENGTSKKTCICGGPKIYKNCHGKTFAKVFQNDLAEIIRQISKYENNTDEK